MLHEIDLRILKEDQPKNFGSQPEAVISVIIPFHNGGDPFYRCLKALWVSSRVPEEVIVVDDASTDASLEVASRFDVRVLQLEEGPLGPAAARNRGAGEAHGDVLVFLDADILIHPKTLEKISEILTAHPEIAAVFGSYDDNPLQRGTISLYKNLQHHYVHHHSLQEASTFWAGCGAIRREVFLKLGGFDESYRRPSVEDIELGLRMARAGYQVWLCPEIQVTHQKKWTLASWLRSDILDRALPWTRLILTTSHLPKDLNLDVRSRTSAVAAWVFVLSLVLAFWFPPAWIGVLLGFLSVLTLNLDLYRFFFQKAGIQFAIFSFGLHTIYYLSSSLTFGILFAWYRLAGKDRANPKTTLSWKKRISE